MTNTIKYLREYFREPLNDFLTLAYGFVGVLALLALLALGLVFVALLVGFIFLCFAFPIIPLLILLALVCVYYAVPKEFRLTPGEEEQSKQAEQIKKLEEEVGRLQGEQQ